MITRESIQLTDTDKELAEGLRFIVKELRIRGYLINVVGTNGTGRSISSTDDIIIKKCEFL